VVELDERLQCCVAIRCIVPAAKKLVSRGEQLEMASWKGCATITNDSATFAGSAGVDTADVAAEQSTWSEGVV